MSQNHALTKRNRRQKSHTRGHEGRDTQLALRSPEAVEVARKQDSEIATARLKATLDSNLSKDLKESKRGKQ